MIGYFWNQSNDISNKNDKNDNNDNNKSFGVINDNDYKEESLPLLIDDNNIVNELSNFDINSLKKVNNKKKIVLSSTQNPVQKELNKIRKKILKIVDEEEEDENVDINYILNYCKRLDNDLSIKTKMLQKLHDDVEYLKNENEKLQIEINEYDNHVPDELFIGDEDADYKVYVENGLFRFAYWDVDEKIWCDVQTINPWNGDNGTVNFNWDLIKNRNE